jgi:uncharacterized Zn finger protein
MVGVKKYVANKSIQSWLTTFFNRVDSGRLKRGRELYHSGALQHFEERESTFLASIQGSRHSPYVVEGEFLSFDSNDRPDPQAIDLECSCPDWIDVCKHSVCAVIQLAVEMDKRLGTSFRPITKKKEQNLVMTSEDKKVEDQLQELERVSRSNPRTLLSLEDAHFWVFKKGLNKAMRDAHGVVSKRLD